MYAAEKISACQVWHACLKLSNPTITTIQDPRLQYSTHSLFLQIYNQRKSNPKLMFYRLVILRFTYLLPQVITVFTISSLSIAKQQSS